MVPWWSCHLPDEIKRERESGEEICVERKMLGKENSTREQEKTE
jgi:hypothetical protein